MSAHRPIPRQRTASPARTPAASRSAPLAPSAAPAAAASRPPGDLVITPLRHGDVAAITQVFEGMSARSRALRFLSPTPRLTQRMQTRLSDVDGQRHFAFAAWVRGRCIGIARAVVATDNGSVADVAVAVVDAHHGQGIGRMLVSAVADRAQALGICTLAVTVDPGNRAALALVRRVTTDAWFEEGVVRANWQLPCAARP